MALKTKRKSLAEKISNLLTPAPVNVGSDDEYEETKAKVVEHYDESDQSDGDFRQSNFRKQNVALLDQEDKRYEGRKVSRKDIYNQDSDNGSNSASDLDDSMQFDTDEDDDEDIEEKNSDEENLSENDQEESDDTADFMKETEESESDEEEENGNENEEEEEEEEEDDYSIIRKDSSITNDDSDNKIKTMTATNIKGDIEKGNSVRNQLKIWENLLEFRIKLQKCLVTSNQLPQHYIHKKFRADKEFVKKTNEVKNNLSIVLNNLLQYQSILLSQFPETKHLDLTNKKQKGNKTNQKSANAENQDDMDEEIPSDMDEEIPSDMDEEIPSDTEDEMQPEKDASNSEKVESEGENEVPRKKMKFSDYEDTLTARHECYRDYRDSVIQKWNDKTRVASGIISKGPTQSALKQIEFALSDKIKLRKRTQLKRSEYTIIGKEQPKEDVDGRRVQEYDPEIYDDDDFYHQLLRDLIEYKSSDITDPIQLSKQWVQLQNMRSKLKRKIDTRATKGRRIRYNIHNKLVNFMAPITVNDTWSDNAKTELYNSLFGKIKPVEGNADYRSTPNKNSSNNLNRDQSY